MSTRGVGDFKSDAYHRYYIHVHMCIMCTYALSMCICKMVCRARCKKFCSLIIPYEHAISCICYGPLRNPDRFKRAAGFEMGWPVLNPAGPISVKQL